MHPTTVASNRRLLQLLFEQSIVSAYRCSHPSNCSLEQNTALLDARKLSNEYTINRRTTSPFGWSELELLLCIRKMEYRILQYLIYSVVLNIYINSVQMAFSNPSLWFSPPSSNIYYPLLHFYCCMTICIYRNSFIHQYCSEMVSFFSDSS